jgi:hypothetical protein
MHHHVLMELRKSLVNIIGDDVQLQIPHGNHNPAKIFPASPWSEAGIDFSKFGANDLSYREKTI